MNTGGGSAAGGAAPITFGYYRRPPEFEGLCLTAGRRPSNDVVADSVGRLGRDSPRKPREGYVELRQAECAVLACMESGPMLNAVLGLCWAKSGPC